MPGGFLRGAPRQHSEGGSSLEFPIDEMIPEIVDGINRGLHHMSLDALPNSGKSKRSPAQLAQRGYNVLVLSPQVGDLPSVSLGVGFQL